MSDKERLDANTRAISGILTQRRLDRTRITKLEQGQARLEQAILELAAAVRAK